MFSSMRLSDGPLSLHAIETLSRSAPVVVLSSCNSAVGHVEAGLELIGFSSLLLQRGAATVIAPVAPLPDGQDTVELMVKLHQKIAGGAAPRRALAQVQAATSSPAAASLVALGS
jgi:CHAT domain-containing protein